MGITDWLRGSVTAVIQGAEPEALLNLCAGENLPLGDVEGEEPFSLTVRVTRRQYARLRQLADRAGCTLTVQTRRGLPFFLGRFRRRYALLAGFLLCLAVAAGGSQVILTIDVTGNQQVTTREILSQLRLCGVSVGTFGPSIPQREVNNRMLLAMKDLSFFSLNLRGTRAEVIVRERVPPPALREDEIPTDVISSATGIITHLEPWSGDAQFQEGDTVCRGDVLISGTMVLDAPPRVETPILGEMLTHAEGRVLARTWHTVTARIPLTAQVKSHTGRQTVRRSLSVLGKRLNFYENSGISYERYDTIVQYRNLVPSGKNSLPVLWETETIREYRLTPAEVDLSAAEALLRSRLLASLEESMDEGQVWKTDYRSEVRDGILSVTLLAECTEQIGRLVERDTDQRVTGPHHPAKGTVAADEKAEETKEQGP